MQDHNGADNTEMARWQGRVEAELEGQKILGEKLRQADQESLEKALTAAQRAIDKAETLVTSRLEGFPQIYATKIEIERLEEAQHKLIEDSLSKDVYDERHAVLDEKISDIRTRLASMEGARGGQSEQSKKDVTRQQWVIGIVVVVAIALANALILFVSTTHGV